MTTGNIRKRIKEKARALTDSLCCHGQPSPSPSVSATDTPASSRSVAGNMVDSVAHEPPVNQSSHQASVPTPTTQVSPEQQLSGTACLANAVSLTDKNKPLTAVCALHYAIRTMLIYPASRTQCPHQNQMIPKDRHHRCGERRSINFLTMTRTAFHSLTTTGAIIWKEFWRR